MKKKIIAICLAAMTSIMLVGCTNLEGNNEDKPNNTLVSEAGSSSISAENPDI